MSGLQPMVPLQMQKRSSQMSKTLCFHVKNKNPKKMFTLAFSIVPGSNWVNPTYNVVCMGWSKPNLKKDRFQKPIGREIAVKRSERLRDFIKCHARPELCNGVTWQSTGTPRIIYESLPDILVRRVFPYFKEIDRTAVFAVNQYPPKDDPAATSLSYMVFRV